MSKMISVTLKNLVESTLRRRVEDLNKEISPEATGSERWSMSSYANEAITEKLVRDGYKIGGMERLVRDLKKIEETEASVPLEVPE